MNSLKCETTYIERQLRRIAYIQGYIQGYVPAEDRKCVLRDFEDIKYRIEKIEKIELVQDELTVFKNKFNKIYVEHNDLEEKHKKLQNEKIQSDEEILKLKNEIKKLHKIKNIYSKYYCDFERKIKNVKNDIDDVQIDNENALKKRKL